MKTTTNTKATTMTTLKAPAGGLVSPVNNQFYAGGEFMPVHGKSTATVASVVKSIKTGLPVYGSGKYIYDVMAHTSLVFHVQADDAQTAESIAKANGAEYWHDIARQF